VSQGTSEDEVEEVAEEAPAETHAPGDAKPEAVVSEHDAAADSDAEDRAEGPRVADDDASSDAAVKPGDAEATEGANPAEPWWRRAALPALVYLVATGVYLVTMGGERVSEHSPDNHYVHLADSWLHGQLHLRGNPPGTNDWACFDTEARDMCPNHRWQFRDERYRWYVSFPPFPAAVILPAVAAFGTDLPDRAFWALLAGVAPLLLFLLLRRLRKEGRSERSVREDLLLTTLFAFGTVYYFTAVQGAVWFAAHVVAVSLLVGYVWCGLDARRPLLAGLLLGLCFLTRPPTALLAIYFGVEALRVSRRDTPVDRDRLIWVQLVQWLRGVQWAAALKRIALFSAPILAIGALAMWHNHARFGDPFEFGHTYLQIRWRDRIETWGLFNFHYLPKNLAVFTSSMPWLSAEAPYVTISRHGLALWFTTPALLLTLWPKRTTLTMVALWCGVIPVAILDLMYQNSGWIQFGYRFALDYMPLLFVLLALGRRRFGPVFVLGVVFAIGVNLFGAITFDRAWQYYDGDATQNVIFQPD